MHRTSAATRSARLKFGGYLVFGVWCLVFLAIPSPAYAQYSVDWHTIDGGSCTSTNGQYSLSGTIGQPDAGPTMSGGNFSVSGGFWSLVTVVQTVSSPTLTLTLTATNTAVISWPHPSTGFALEQNSDLGTSNWTSVTNTVSYDGSIQWVVVPANAGNKFFRLKK